MRKSPPWLRSNDLFDGVIGDRERDAIGDTGAKSRFATYARLINRRVEFVNVSEAIRTSAHVRLDVAKAVTVRPENIHRNSAVSQNQPVTSRRLNVNPERIVVAACQAMVIRFQNKSGTMTESDS